MSTCTPEPSASLAATVAAADVVRARVQGGGAPDPWADSPFAWIRTFSSGARGAIGEELVAQLALAAGLSVARSPSPQADRVIDGVAVEVKLSTRWGRGGYKFQQIRDQDYDLAVLLGLSPHEVHMWAVPKSALRQHVIGHLGQHTGARGHETAWLGFPTHTPPAWLAPYGPTTERALAQITALSGRLAAAA